MNPIAEIGADIMQRARVASLHDNLRIRERAVIVLCQRIARENRIDAVSQTSLRLELAMLESAQEAVDSL